jgi:uncharacterized Ntn-hydrolase superfamily protein
MCGRGYAVQGNILAGGQVVEAMAASFEEGEGEPFLERLVMALLAGDEAGGDRRGRQAAAVRIWGGTPIDLRVDDHERPVHRLVGLVEKAPVFGPIDELEPAGHAA